MCVVVVTICELRCEQSHLLCAPRQLAASCRVIKRCSVNNVETVFSSSLLFDEFASSEARAKTSSILVLKSCILPINYAHSEGIIEVKWRLAIGWPNGSMV